MEKNLVAKVLFPIFTVAHGVMWHTCKFHENDGTCVQLFGLFWDGNHHHASTAAAAEEEQAKAFITSFWQRLTTPSHQEVKNEMLERQQHYRLELVREVNLALAVLCALSIFVKSETIRTQMLFVESVVFGLAAYDASQMMNGSTLTLPMVLLVLLALLGLVIQVRKDPVVAEEIFNATPKEEIQVQESREPFEKLPADIQDLMAKSAEEISTLPLFPDESTVKATVVKPTKDSTVGISVKKIANDWRVVIQRISSDGLFADSPLRVGQTVLAVNGIPVNETTSARDITSIIKEASDVTIVATKSIRVHVVKPTKESRVGISFSRFRKQLGSLAIHTMNGDSLFGGTGLEEGMRVVAINNKASPSLLKDAGQLVKDTDGDLILHVVKDDDHSNNNKQTASSPTPSSNMVVAKKVIQSDEQPAESAPPLPMKEVSVKGTKSEF